MKNFVSLTFLLINCVSGCTIVSAQDTIHLKKYLGNLRTIDVFIEKEMYNFLFDTGGGETFISPEIVKKLNRFAYSSVYGFRMTGEVVKTKKCDSLQLMAGKTLLVPNTVLVWDIMSVLPKGLPRIDGVLSMKSFIGMKIQIDLNAELLIIENNSSFRKKIKSATLINTRFASGLAGNELNIFLEVRSPRQYWFLFDSGNIDQIIISKNTAVEWGKGVDSSKIENRFFEAEIRLGNTKCIVNGRISDIIYDGVFDYSFIKKNIYLFDLKSNKVWMK